MEKKKGSLYFGGTNGCPPEGRRNQRGTYGARVIEGKKEIFLLSGLSNVKEGGRPQKSGGVTGCDKMWNKKGEEGGPCVKKKAKA